MASATFKKPAILAPAIRFPSMPYFFAAPSMLLKIFFIIFFNFSSTSSSVHESFMAFWLISRADTATPPALTAFDGAIINPAFCSSSTASALVGMLATSIKSFDVPSSIMRFASSNPISFCVAQGIYTSAFTRPHGFSPAWNSTPNLSA